MKCKQKQLSPTSPTPAALTPFLPTWIDRGVQAGAGAAHPGSKYRLGRLFCASAQNVQK